MGSKAGTIGLIVAFVMVVGVTVVQGLWTERWVELETGSLTVAAEQLERTFPATFGDWKMEKQLDMNPAELERAGAAGSISRVYRNQKTKTAISAFVVCALPHHASSHTPDRCYPGAGFRIAEVEHQTTIPLRDGRTAEAFEGTFEKPGQTLRIFWTYGTPGTSAPGANEDARQADAKGDDAPAALLTWWAPRVARTALSRYPSVYKMYAIIDQTNIPGPRASAECQDFIAELLPALEASLARGAGAESPAEPAAPEPAAG